MKPLLGALALLMAVVGLGCATDEAPSAPFEFPPLDVPEPDIDWPMLPADVFSPGIPGEPSLWQAKSAVGSFYLFGSVHVGDARTSEFGPDVEAAYAGSEEVVLEIDLDAVEPEETLALARRYGSLEPPATLESLVSPETWSLLERTFADAGRSVEAVQSVQPWLVSFGLASGAFLAAGLDPQRGVDQQVQERARGRRGGGNGSAGGAKKPVVGLETLESQFQMLAGLPLEVQDHLLRDALEPDPDSGIDPSKLVESWRRGDVSALSELLEPSTPEMALFYEHLVYRRNEQMADRLFEMAGDGKVRFVVVGILHLLGERGIPALLAKRGFLVSRVE